MHEFGARAFLEEAWIRVRERYADRNKGNRPLPQHKSDDDWEQALHQHLQVEWPCKVADEFWPLWTKVMGELEGLGIRAGPASFKAYNDGDAGFLRTIWCLVRHLRPDKVIETGVAHGVSSRVILEALEINGAGHLWSIDLPPMERVWQKQVGVAVGDRFADRWSFMKGSSRRLLPDLLARIGTIDLFIHDSLHSDRNVRFEMDQAFSALRPGGALVVDDVDVNHAFGSFIEEVSGFKSMICEGEPIRPDERRFNRKGLFGIVLKAPLARAARV